MSRVFVELMEFYQQGSNAKLQQLCMFHFEVSQPRFWSLIAHDCCPFTRRKIRMALAALRR
jgi:hypothetical protein